MADIRKAKLRRLEKTLASISERNLNIDLNNMQLYKDINEFHEVRREAFYLKFEIEHCSECSQLLPKYAKKTHSKETEKRRKVLV